jgi:branched-chain amino acid transport system substrate-binding protein
MKNHRRLGALVLVVALASVAPTSAAPTVSGAPVTIPVITSTTGYLSFLGKEQERALHVLEGVVNDEGGIGGRPVKFEVQDDQSSPQIAVQFGAKIISDGKPVMIGPQTTSGCNAIYPMAKNGPALYCLSPAFQPEANSFGFVSNSNTNDEAIAIVRYFRLRGWTRIAVLNTIDAAGQSLDKGFAAAFKLPENKNVQVVAYEHFAIADISVAGQLAKIRAANPQALIAWATGTPVGTVLRSVRDAGLDLPIATGTGNMTYSQMAEYAGFMPKELVFPGLRALTRNGTASGPIYDAQVKYFKAFSAQGGRPDYADDLIWDPALLLVDTLRHIGPNGSADAARKYLTTLHGFAGINGLYDFRDGSQRGLGIGSVIMDRWDPAKNDFVAVSKPGGYI